MPVARDGSGPRHNVSRRPYRPPARKPAPKPRPAPAPNFPRAIPRKPGAVTPRPVHLPPPARPVRSKEWLARKAQRDLKRQAGAVRRVAKVQKKLGPGMAVHGGKQLAGHDIKRVQRSKVTQSLLQERAYPSQGRAVTHAARTQDEDARRRAEDYARGTTRKVKGSDVAAATVPGLGIRIVPKSLTDVIDYTKDVVKNAPKDVLELAITTPSSVIHSQVETAKALGKTVTTGSPKPLAKEVVREAKEVADPYVQLAKDPIGFSRKRPVTAGLMAAPVVKVPGRAAGRVARGVKVKGKIVVKPRQTLERPAATLEGTSMRVARTGSRDYFVRRHQAREDAANPTPKITRRQMERRIDEFNDWTHQHQKRAEISAARKAREKHTEGKSRKERFQTRKEGREKVREKVEGAGKGQPKQARRELARQFGSHWYVDPKSGGVVKPKRAPEGSGRIYATKEEADRVLNSMPNKDNFKRITIKGKKPGKTGGFAVVPTKVIADVGKHKRVGHGGFAIGPGLRILGRSFRKTVLPFSPKWMMGQVGEGAFRGAVAGVNPASYARYAKVMAHLRKHDPDAARRLEELTTGGQFGSTGSFREFVGNKPVKTLEEQLADTRRLAGVGRTATKVGKMWLPRQARKAQDAYNRTVFDRVNGSLEEFYKRGMVGVAIKKSPLMEQRVLGLSSNAVKEAADGLRGTSSQIELARAMDRMYGKYSKYGPDARDAILHSTPFIPWFINMGKFLGTVLPNDHPVMTALAASYAEADKEWRKQHRLSLYGNDRAPDFLLGGAPKGGGYVPVNRFLPFLPGEYASAIGGQYMPGLQGSLLNLSGVDWTGRPLGNDSQGNLALNAGLTGIESMVPLAAQIDRATGLGEHYVRGKKDKPSIVQGKSIKQGALDVINPLKPIGTSGGKRKKKRRSSNPLGGTLGGAGGLLGGTLKR